MKIFSDEKHKNESDNKTVRELVFSRAFREDSIKKLGNNIRIKKADNTWVTFPADVLYSEICDVIDPLYKATKRATDKIKTDASQKQDYSPVLQWTNTVILLSERSKRLYKDNKSDEYEKFATVLDEIKSDIKECIPRKTFLDMLYYLCTSDERIFEEITKLFGLEKIDDEDLINIIKNDIGKQDFSDRLYMYKDAILNSPKVLSTLEKEGYITEESLKAADPESEIYKLYRNTKKNYLLKYLKTPEYFMLYEDDLIDTKTLVKHTKLKDLLESYLSKDTKMTLLKSKAYSGHESNLIWNLFESGFFSAEEIYVLSNLSYIRINTIVEKYLEQQKRKIAKELNQESQIDEKKLLEIFTPEYVLAQINSKSLPESINLFITNNLKELYKKDDRDLPEELIQTVQSKNKENDNQTNTELINLYERGMISGSELGKCQIPEKFLLDYFRKNGSKPETLIEFYNNGLFSQDTIFEIYEENTDFIFELIKQGLKSTVIQGFFSTKELIEYMKLEKLSVSDLAQIKSDIKIEDLEKLYLEEKSLSFAELFELAEYDVINETDANNINDKYNLQNAIDELTKRGIQGKKYGPQVSQVTPVNPNPIVPKPPKKQAKGLSPRLQNLLFGVLGASPDTIRFNEGHPFAGCILIPIISKKVGIIEGDSRTCVVPLKVAIEYIENPGSAEDIFGNATCRKDVYTSKKYVSSLNHTKKWGDNLIKAVVDRSTVLQKTDIQRLRRQANTQIIDGRPLLEALQKSYEDRKKGVTL